MRYAGIIENDFVNGVGVCVSFWTQGCPHLCPGCHNPETWDYEGGRDAGEDDLIDEIRDAISANGIQRNLSLLGGEPLCPENVDFIQLLIYWIKIWYPNIKIYCWSGYTLEQLQKRAKSEKFVKYVLDNIDMLAAGPYVDEQRDITLPFVGSRNQIVWWKDGNGEWVK